MLALSLIFAGRTNPLAHQESCSSNSESRSVNSEI